MSIEKTDFDTSAADTANIERAVRKLTSEFRRLLIRTQSKGFAFDILVVHFFVVCSL